MKKDMMKSFMFVVSIFVAAGMLLSCQNKGKCVEKQDDGDSSDFIEETEYIYDNPLDSIVHYTLADNRMEKVFEFLSSHPDFVNGKQDIGYHTYSNGVVEPSDMLWKDCGKIRVYSIPLENIYTTLYYYIVQYKGTRGAIDTISLQDIDGHMNEISEITSKDGKTYYLLSSDQFVQHSGTLLRETVYAFSLGKNGLVKEKLFHNKNGQYDHIEVNCGGQRYCPLDYSNISLIQLPGTECDDSEVPTVILAMINENDWPTGYGLKYQWDGYCFQYVGKCKYDADACF